MRKHNIRCETAQSKKCRCRCGGQEHNPKSRDTGDQNERLPLTDTALFNGEPDFNIKEGVFSGELKFWREDGPMTNVDRKLVYHSPDGFEWGYGGSGPSDLALNILAVFLNPTAAWKLHQDFKWAFISTLPNEGGVIHSDSVKSWILANAGKKAEAI